MPIEHPSAGGNNAASGENNEAEMRERVRRYEHLLASGGKIMHERTPYEGSFAASLGNLATSVRGDEEKSKGRAMGKGRDFPSNNDAVKGVDNGGIDCVGSGGGDSASATTAPHSAGVGTGTAPDPIVKQDQGTGTGIGPTKAFADLLRCVFVGSGSAQAEPHLDDA